MTIKQEHDVMKVEVIQHQNHISNQESLNIKSIRENN